MTHTAASDPMPNPEHSAMLCRIVERHGIGQQQLATEAGMHRSHVCRILNGQYPVTTDITSALFRLTGDDEIALIALSPDVIEVMRRIQFPAHPQPKGAA